MKWLRRFLRPRPNRFIEMLVQQADYTVRAFTWAREWGHAGVMFLWNLNYWSAAGPYSEMAKFSIVRGNWTPRPVYIAYRDMVKASQALEIYQREGIYGPH